MRPKSADSLPDGKAAAAQSIFSSLGKSLEESGATCPPKSIVSIMQGIIETSACNANGKSPKLDELWKPLLRGFRAFHRIELDSNISERNARNLGKTTLSRLFLHEARQYLLSIGASELLVRSKVNLHALIVLALRIAPKNLTRDLKNLPAV